ncbi:MAG: TolC family protein [Bacteroidales bacterium]
MKFKYILPAALLFSTLAVNAQTELSLNSYREMVLNYNQDVKKSQEGVVAATASQKSVRAGFLPSIELQGDYNFNMKDYSSIGMPRNMYNAKATLTQNIWDGGYTWASNQQGKIERDIAVLAENQTVNSILYQADMIYWTASANKDMYETMQQYNNIVKNLYDIINKRFEDGLIARTDLLMVQTRLKEAEGALNNARKSYLLANQNLNILMGAEPTAENEAGEPIVTHVAVPESVTLEQALESRPEYAIAEKQVELAKQSVSLVKSKTNPKVYVGAQAAYGNQNMLIGEGWQSGIFAGVRIPILQGGSRIYSTRAAKANAVIKELSLQQTQDAISQQLSNALTNVEMSSESIRIATENLSIAKQSLDINTFSYSEGRLTILDVLQSQLSWIQASSSLIQANLMNKIAIAEYRMVIGE